MRDGARGKQILSVVVFTASLLIATASAKADAGDFDAPGYRFTRYTPIYKCSVNGTALAPRADALASPTWRFDVVARVPDATTPPPLPARLVIKFLRWGTSILREDSEVNAMNSAFVGTTTAPLLWCVDAVDVEKKVQEYFWKKRPNLNFGALLVPIKLRGGIGEKRYVNFTKDVTLAGALDINWLLPGDGSWAVHIPIFAGLGSVQVEPGSSKLEEGRAVPALSTGLGLGVSTTHGAIGLLLGIDIIEKNREKGGSIAWAYQGRPWLGISLGTTFGTQSGEPAAAQ